MPIVNSDRHGVLLPYIRGNIRISKSIPVSLMATKYYEKDNAHEGFAAEMPLSISTLIGHLLALGSI
jgi:hypothetical protein